MIIFYKKTRQKMNNKLLVQTLVNHSCVICSCEFWLYCVTFLHILGCSKLSPLSGLFSASLQGLPQCFYLVNLSKVDSLAKWLLSGEFRILLTTKYVQSVTQSELRVKMLFQRYLLVFIYCSAYHLKAYLIRNMIPIVLIISGVKKKTGRARNPVTWTNLVFLFLSETE